jgi:hypothetical protein
MLLEDVFIIENLQVLNEGKGGPMRVRGVFQRADEENNNKRIYPKALLEREIQKLDEAMKGRRLMGELDHPSHDSVKLSNVSHLITKLEAKGNEIIGEAEILDTPMGKVAKALIEGGVQVGISSRGMGTLSEGQDGKRYVNEDFRLITWDLVADPSTRGAFPTLAESNNLNSMLVEEILNDVLPKVTQQKVFSTLLADRLDEKLRGKQHKLDKNKNGRLDSQDFKMLRGQRKDEALPAAIGAVAGGLARGAAVAGRAAAKGAVTVGKAALKATKAGVKGATRAAGSMAREGVRSAGAAAGQTAANRVADRMERRTESTSFPRLSQIFEAEKKPFENLAKNVAAFDAHVKKTSGMRTPKKSTRTRNYGPVKQGDSGRIADTKVESTLFPRVGAVLFEGLPAAKRVGEVDAQGNPTGMSYVSPGRTGKVVSGYGKKGGRLVGKDKKAHGFARQALGRYTQVDSTGKIPQPKKS